MDWNLLRTFQVVAQELSISRAAVRLHLSQPAVSQALKRLEEQIGTALIERHGPRFMLTPSGIETLRVATEVYGQFAQLDAALEQSSDQVVGKIRLLTVSGIQCTAYDHFLATLHRDYPGITLEIEVHSSDAIISALSQKTATFGLAVNRTAYAWLGQQCLTRERYGFYCSDLHPLFGRPGLSLNDLRAENLISFTGDLLGGTLSALAEFRDRHNLNGHIVASSANTQEVLRLVLAGFGIGCLPEHVCKDAISAGRLWRLPPDDAVCEVDINLLWHLDQRLTMAETAFLQRLRSVHQNVQVLP
ncbi:LysR family transcriptional regulator [Pseudomonas sp. LP_7_YM]|uniref:LysR family transcriptional regulator n=1 Tax=Pseudomonas sp. LP_7_YM TaxID=2485137 RepID=UPI0010DFA832|nr:LysR family transcriptional regulator [Pseudomonas sp. LP_7_YM]TDV59712.1 LysR family transcriptional regulator [Pseudomonas sp. LP_7_YM]